MSQAFRIILKRIIQEYFQPKIGRKIRIFSLGRKNNILIIKKGCRWYNLIARTIFSKWARTTFTSFTLNPPLAF